jgi:hypothetical protein
MQVAEEFTTRSLGVAGTAAVEITVVVPGVVAIENVTGTSKPNTNDNGI